ncbi:hypothetical protein EG347_20740 [Chryseobacterium sp. G0186]|uniref:hypothetical protein n=1 Tax=Chryseobacterium sp. G0186 TaxID=2487064 RepID=UPI000F4DE4ED|nr:hypothetical protein [Chryseobacterium sp. G0186]AZA79737.1 hypothetical protein EG347_20740 [Chryseobacterium sp. G0186]
MSKKKFILLAILKTWFISTVVSVILIIIFLNVTREVEMKEHPRNCDMSGLAYAFVVFWILFLSILSLSSLFSLLKSFCRKVKEALCWFLLPAISFVFYYCTVADGKINRDDIALFLITYLPWFVLWILYYRRFNSLFK